MKKENPLFFIFLAALRFAAAQSPIADFTVLPVVCRDQFINIDNNTVGASTYEWDFCLNDAETLSANEQLTSIPGLNGGYGYKLVEDNGLWFGFATSENNHSLYRLDFGNSPMNAPVVNNLGNPGSLLVYPEGIEVVKNAGNWFAFIGSFNINQGIVKLSFGSSLTTDSPTAENIGNFGFSTRFRGLKAVKQGTDNILLLAAYNLNSIIRINYRDSFDNPIASGDIVDSGPLAGFGNPLGMDIAPNLLGETVMLVTSYNGGTISQLNFGSDILSSPTVEANYAFPEIAKPYYVKFIREGNNYYAVVTNESLPVTVLNFHDLDPAQPSKTVSHAALPVAGGIETFRSFGKTYVHTTGTSNTSLRLLTFESPCDCSLSFFSGENPPLVKYSNAGNKTVELKAFNDSGMSLKAQEISVSSDYSPDISFTSTNLCVDHDIYFITENISGDLAAYDWNFDDMTQSSDPDPIHQFTSGGSYRVSLRVTATNGCENLYSSDVTVYPEPAADFLSPPGLMCTNNAFTMPSITPDVYEGNLSYQWFVDGSAASTERDLEYTFSATGPKDIRLITSLPGCSSEITKTTSPVEAGPVVEFTYSGTCEGESFDFGNQITDPVESYLWDFDNGQTSAEANPTQQFVTFGNYSVSLRATNAIGCENVKTKVITVHANPLVDFALEGPPNACSGTSVLLRDQTTLADGAEITQWLWDITDLNNSATESTRDPEHIFKDAGIYPVSLTATSAFGCAAATQKDIVIYASPSAAFTFTPPCKDVPVLFSSPPDPDIVYSYWEIGTAYYRSASPTHTFKSAGDFPLYLEVTGANGCTSKVSEVIHVAPPVNPDFSYLKNCVGQEAVFTDITAGIDSVRTREWTFNSGEAFTGSTFAYTFPAQGKKTLSLKVTTKSGCDYVTIKEVEVIPAPVAAFSPDPVSGAYPLEVRFINNSSGATQYLWEFNDNTGTTSTEVSPVYTFDGQGSYNVKLTALNGQNCEASFTGAITTVAPLPDVDIDMLTLKKNEDGSVKMIVTLNNKGNTVLTNLPLDIDFAGSVKFRQLVDEPIFPNTRYNFVFNTGILNIENVRYLCVSIDLENDVSPYENRMCKELKNDLFVFPAFPNPTTGAVNLEWVREGESMMVISLTDALGRTIMSEEVAGVSGLNRRSLDLSGLQNGLYNLLFDDGMIRARQRIILTDKP